VHGFLSIPAIFRALYDLSIAYNIILYNILDVFQDPLFAMVLLPSWLDAKRVPIENGP
jgi:hypothetical protein